MAKRNWLVGAYRQRINEANEMLERIENNNDMELLNTKMGGILTDQHFINKSGKFRSIASKLNKKELEDMINILDDFLTHEHHVYEKSKELTELARRLGVDESQANRVLALMEYAESKIQAGILSSYQIRETIKRRINDGQSFSNIKKSIDKAIKDSGQDSDMLFTLLTENGKWI